MMADTSFIRFPSCLSGTRRQTGVWHRRRQFQAQKMARRERIAGPQVTAATRKRRRRGTREEVGSRTRWTTRGAALVHRFPVQIDVEALDLLFVGHAQADQRIDDLEKDEGGDGAPGDADQAAPELGQDLAAIAVYKPPLALAADRLDGEHAGQDGADETADAVHAEGVERIVVAHRPLEAGGAPEADEAGNDADRQSAH